MVARESESNQAEAEVGECDGAARLKESAKCGETEAGYWVRNESSREVQERVEAMQWINSAGDRATYRERQREVSKQLKLSIRQVQRLIKLWETSGIGGLERKERSDRGQRRVDEDWTNYIVQT